ncbi:MAG: hypothetical protein JNJ61_04450 [Anaerolineae bacterium]|nr:hypothetical protein [Anaerolineae bacterium]
MGQGTSGAVDERFNDLMQAGRTAFAAGKRETAHDLWREAATLNPYSEQVWLALLDVVEEDQDKLVCLQNILQINPMNVQARRLMNKVETQLERRQHHEAEQSRRQKGMKRYRRTVLLRAMLLGIAIGLSGLFFAVVISILLYAR